MQRADFAEVLGRRLLNPGCWLQVITDITRQMGEGMAEFITKEVETVADYDKCASHAALHTSKRLAGSLAEGLVGAQPWQTAPMLERVLTQVAAQYHAATCLVTVAHGAMLWCSCPATAQVVQRAPLDSSHGPEP